MILLKEFKETLWDDSFQESERIRPQMNQAQNESALIRTRRGNKAVIQLCLQCKYEAAGASVSLVISELHRYDTLSQFKSSNLPLFSTVYVKTVKDACEKWIWFIFHTRIYHWQWRLWRRLSLFWQYSPELLQKKSPFRAHDRVLSPPMTECFIWKVTYLQLHVETLKM